MRKSTIAPLALLAFALLSAAPLQSQVPPKRGEGTAPGESAGGLDMQAARAKAMTARGKKTAYTKKFDLSGLPEYHPQQQVSGVIRVWGSNYITDGMVGGLWEQAFRKYQPGITFEWHMETTSAAVPSLIFGVSDLGIGRKVTFSELQLYQRYTNHDPLEIDIATGSYNVPGWNPGFGVIVSRDNPLQHISMEQLDGIFGAARAGGWSGTDWHAEWARGPEKNLRTWGQLGLKGEWADKPINVYGLNLRYHQATEISDHILHSSDKWNENLKIYANYVKADGTLSRNMNDDLAADRYGIGIVAAPTTTLGGADAKPTSKILPLGETDAGPFIPYSLETIQNRTYPMFDRIYAYFNAPEKGAPDPKVVEFLRFITSRQGQQLVMQDGKYLPLTAEASRAALARLSAPPPN